MSLVWYHVFIVPGLVALFVLSVAFHTWSEQPGP